MHPYCLQFIGDDVETEYRIMIFNTTCKSVKRKLFVLTLIMILWVCYNGIICRVFNASVAVPLFLSFMIGMIGYTVDMYPRLFDYVLFTFQVGLNVFWCFCQGFDLNAGFFNGSNSYTLGQTVAYLTQSYNVGSRTYLKMISILINTISMFCFLVIKNQDNFRFLSLLILTSGGMYMYHIRSDDRCRRQAYLTRIQQEKWEENLDEVADIGLIQCTFDKNNNSLKLLKSNKISQAQFYIKDQDQSIFKDFTRQLLVSIPKHGKSQKDQKFNLEQLLFYMFTDFKKLSILVDRRLDMYNQSPFKFKGVYQQINYKVQIFSFWKTEQIAVISISKLEDTLEMRTMKCKLKICRMAINTYQQQLQQTLVPSIAFLRQLSCFKEFSKQLSQGNLHQLFSFAQYKLYESFRRNMNILIFFKPKFEVKYQIFQPAHAIDRALKVLQHQIALKGIRIITEQAPEQIKITSNYQLFQQLIMNVLEQIMHVSQRRGEIYVLFQPGRLTQSQSSIHDYIQFTLLTNTTSATKLLANQIWVLNPLSQKNVEKVCFTKQVLSHNIFKLNINLCVSHYIVGLLGPYSKIEYIQDENGMCTIFFRIYVNLRKVKQGIQNPPKLDLSTTNNGNLINETLVPPKSQTRISLLRTINNLTDRLELSQPL